MRRYGGLKLYIDGSVLDRKPSVSPKLQGGGPRCHGTSAKLYEDNTEGEGASNVRILLPTTSEFGYNQV